MWAKNYRLWQKGKLCVEVKISENRRRLKSFNYSHVEPSLLLVYVSWIYDQQLFVIYKSQTTWTKAAELGNIFSRMPPDTTKSLKSEFNCHFISKDVPGNNKVFHSVSYTSFFYYLSELLYNRHGWLEKKRETKTEREGNNDNSDDAAAAAADDERRLLRCRWFQPPRLRFVKLATRFAPMNKGQLGYVRPSLCIYWKKEKSAFSLSMFSWESNTPSRIAHWLEQVRSGPLEIHFFRILYVWEHESLDCNHCQRLQYSKFQNCVFLSDDLKVFSQYSHCCRT